MTLIKCKKCENDMKTAQDELFMINDNQKSLVLAIRNGDTDQVKAILYSGIVDVNCIFPIGKYYNEQGKEIFYGCTYLILAIRCGNHEIVNILLESGADINKGTQECTYNYKEIYLWSNEQFVDCNDLVLFRNYNGDPNLRARFDVDSSFSVFYDPWCLYIIEKRDHGLSGNRHIGCTALIYSIIMYNNELFNKDIFNILVGHIRKKIHSSTELIFKAQQGISMAMFALKKLYTVNMSDNGSNTALMVAAKNGDIDIAKSLLELGADISMCNKDGNTALIIANKNYHLNIGSILKKISEASVSSNRVGLINRLAI